MVWNRYGNEIAKYPQFFSCFKKTFECLKLKVDKQVLGMKTSRDAGIALWMIN